jgi:hypothetical protein
MAICRRTAKPAPIWVRMIGTLGGIGAVMTSMIGSPNAKPTEPPAATASRDQISRFRSSDRCAVRGIVADRTASVMGSSWRRGERGRG